MPAGGVLDGRVAIVTGAARGIGAAAARALAADGAIVHLSDVDECEPTARSCRDGGPQAHAHRLDITDEPACRKLSERVLERDGRIDILVANAGVCPPGSIGGDRAQWRRVLETNLDGTQHCVAAVWPAMVKAGSGTIVIVSSMAFYRGGVIVGPEYTASKAALIGLTRHLARNGGPLGIRCNAVAPGIIETDMTAEFDRPPLDEIPLGRYGSAADVAGPIRFLSGPESAYMTGTVLNVTGGMVLAA